MTVKKAAVFLSHYDYKARLNELYEETFCKQERVRKSWFSACGMNGKLWVPKDDNEPIPPRQD